jgi:hypothetical protein
MPFGTQVCEKKFVRPDPISHPKAALQLVEVQVDLCLWRQLADRQVIPFVPSSGNLPFDMVLTATLSRWDAISLP